MALLTAGEARAARAYKAAPSGYGRGLNDLRHHACRPSRAGARSASQLTSAQVQALRSAVQAYKALGGGWPGSRPTPPKRSTERAEARRELTA